MFRGTSKVEMNKKYFSVGSVMKMGNFDSYLVICQGLYASLVDLKTFELVHKSSVKVEDPNYISQAEAGLLANTVGCTLSDFDIDAKGFKQ